ncbi:CrcB protein [Frigoribacterium sp. PvP054]
MIAPWLFVATAVAGGVGAALRLIVDGAVRSTWSAPIPLATLAINVSGSFVLGLLTGLADHAGLPREWLLVAGGGLMGGYTTFSTASVETVRLMAEKKWVAGIANGAGMLLLAVAAGLVGLTIGTS